MDERRSFFHAWESAAAATFCCTLEFFLFLSYSDSLLAVRESRSVLLPRTRSFIHSCARLALG